jgi:dehydrodolichyl diphosphate syntase complex subunit NUS1
MGVLAFLCLRILHWLYALTAFVLSFVRHFRRKPPQPLNAQRAQLPTHLAVILHSERNDQTEGTEKIYLESVKTAIACCRTLGIKRLTVYDYSGAQSISTFPSCWKMTAMPGSKASFFLPSKDSTVWESGTLSLRPSL